MLNDFRVAFVRRAFILGRNYRHAHMFRTRTRPDTTPSPKPLKIAPIGYCTRFGCE